MYKETMNKKSVLLIIFLCGFVATAFNASCSKTQEKKSNVVINKTVKAEFNELGKILVVEYHRISSNEGEWTRSVENFKLDLERYYKLGYRLTSLNDVFNKSIINVPRGKKPLIMTFDDGHPSQFRYLIVNGQTVEGESRLPKIDPNCAIGILDEFYKKHNDFGRSATFFLNSNPFFQKECPALWKEKLKYLVNTGREIGNHTFNHDNLSKLSYLQIKKTLALQQKKIEEALPSYMANSIALPYGAHPKKGNWLLQKGSYNGINYNYRVAFLVGAEPAHVPYHKNFIPYMVPRVQADDHELNKWLGKIKKNPSNYFISDGDPLTISINEKDASLLDKTQLNENSKIKIFRNGSLIKKINVPSKSERMKKIKTANRGVYLTFHSAGIKKKIDSIIENYKKTGLDSVVIDIKDVEGTIGTPLDVPLAKKIGACDRVFIDDLKSLIDLFHSSGITVSIRIAIFKDRFLVKKRPDLALKSKSGAVWVENDGRNWVDPFLKEVVDYNVDIAVEAAKAGADEIQFDYIRFPEKGHEENIAVPEGKEKYMAVENFLKRAYERLEPFNVSIAVDVFGVMAWERDRDIAITGQRVGEMAKYVFAVCPMLYPSHFDSGFNGYKNPANEPYHFVKEGCIRVKEMVKNEEVKIIPWIQGFKWRVKNFNEDYILQQKKAAEDCGINSFLVWNAGNNYEITFKALNKNLPGSNSHAR